MTLPFENDTRIIVKKLAKRNLKADKSRNILIIITIALATCLIMTTTLYFFASQRKSLNDAAGRYQAIINEVDNDTITKLVNDDNSIYQSYYRFGVYPCYLQSVLCVHSQKNKRIWKTADNRGNWKTDEKNRF